MIKNKNKAGREPEAEKKFSIVLGHVLENTKVRNDFAFPLRTGPALTPKPGSGGVSESAESHGEDQGRYQRPQSIPIAGQFTNIDTAFAPVPFSCQNNIRERPDAGFTIIRLKEALLRDNGREKPSA